MAAASCGERRAASRPPPGTEAGSRALSSPRAPSNRGRHHGPHALDRRPHPGLRPRHVDDAPPPAVNRAPRVRGVAGRAPPPPRLRGGGGEAARRAVRPPPAQPRPPRRRAGEAPEVDQLGRAAAGEAVRHEEVAPGGVAQRLDAARLVDGPADGGEVESVRRADVAVDDLAVVEREVGLERGLAGAAPVLLQQAVVGEAGPGGLQRPPADRAGQRGAVVRGEDRDEAVARELQDLAAIRLDPEAQRVEVLVEPADEAARVLPVGRRREALEVDEQDGGRHQLPLPPPDLPRHDALRPCAARDRRRAARSASSTGTGAAPPGRRPAGGAR